MNSLQDHRDAYARLVARSAGSANPRLIDAFACTPREHYLGKGPWPILAGAGCPPTMSSDPGLLYQDVLVGLATDRGINNGQPTLHARCMVACDPRPGESVIHIGAGTGYYTAILAALVGTGGRVQAYEIEADLAARASGNLRHLKQVQVLCASGAEAALSPADLIYVSAGATHPLPAWLDALRPGGRLIFPLTPRQGFGGMLLVTRPADGGEEHYAAGFISRVAFVPCMGARDEATADALAAAFESRPTAAVKSLRRGTDADDRAWCAGRGWWLSTAESR